MYLWPLSDQEYRRLEATAKRIRELLDEKVVHAPLEPSSIRKVIDVGCGTGVTTDELGTTFPKAMVYGVDLSAVPALRPKLDNIEYIQGDVMELAATDTDYRLAKGSFNYVFSRFLMGGITEWKRYIELCLALAKPGVSHLFFLDHLILLTDAVRPGSKCKSQTWPASCCHLLETHMMYIRRLRPWRYSRRRLRL